MADPDAYLELKLESGSEKPIGVGELGLALTSISDMYEDFAIKMGAQGSDSKFEIKDLRKGSAIVEIIGASIGLMDQALILKQFHGSMKTHISAWTGIVGGSPKALKSGMAQAKKLEGMARAVAESQDGNLALAYKRETTDETEVLMMTKQDGQAMLENFAAARQSIKDNVPVLESGGKARVLMRLYQHNQDPDPSNKKRTSHKAIVRDIDQKPRPLTYETSEVAEELKEIVSQVPYAENIFDVDLELIREDGNSKTYRLVNIHGYFDDPDLPLLEAS